MQIPLLNHIISFANVPDIDSYLERYEKAGFVVAEQTVRHAPGKRNGFVNFGPEYIEFFWVEDQKLFNQKGEGYAKAFRRKPRPFGIALDSQSVDNFHKASVKKGFKLKPTWSKPMKEAEDSNPYWAFQDIPLRYLPGAWTFALTYLRRDQKKPRSVQIGKNTIYGISGVTFISAKPESRASQWKKFIGEKSRTVKKVGTGRYQLQLGPHVLEWMTSKTYKDIYSLVQSPQIRNDFSRYQEIALIHLLATDVKKAREMLDKNGFETQVCEEGFFIKPDKRDGFAFLVHEADPEEWAKKRSPYGLLQLVESGIVSA